MKTSSLRHANSLNNKFLTSWVANPGVIYGCEVVKGQGLGLTVLPGKIFSQNGASAEITSTLNNIVSVIPSNGAPRIDYVSAVISGSGVSIQYIRGDDYRARNSGQLQLFDGVLLAKVLVKYPTVDPITSAKIYNVLPSNGETNISNFRLPGYPDGVETRFRLPFRLAIGYASRVLIDNIPQYEDSDYQVELVQSNSGPVSEIVFSNPPSEGSDIVLDLYLGKIDIPKVPLPPFVSYYSTPGTLPDESLVHDPFPMFISSFIHINHGGGGEAEDAPHAIVTNFDSPYVHYNTYSWVEPPSVSIIQSSISSGVQYREYEFQFNSIGSYPFVWTITGLPAGLTYDSNTGEISGIPTSFGVFSIDVQVTDRLGYFDSQSMLLTIISGNQNPFIKSIPPGEVNRTKDFVINGLWFGAVQGSSTVMINATLCPIVSWADKLIIATAPAAASTGVVKVTVGGIDSNLVGITVLA